RIDEILIRRNRIAELYTKRLNRIENVITLIVPTEIKMSWFVYVVQLNPQKFSRDKRDEVITRLAEKGVNCRDRFPPIHLEPLFVKMFGYKAGDFPITERSSGSTIALPFHNNLTEEEIDYVCSSLAEVLGKLK
ncbi:MAG: DegT/DnrJ/EryC1/StrS family aminotransferase, partial [Candidatus Nealsonbacteria bacterium]|nr:DegT/DnrJ/EryC1/StrS family aminotransferase [Candidatus Nealsonbacteria bacterium]